MVKTKLTAQQRQDIKVLSELITRTMDTPGRPPIKPYFESVINKTTVLHKKFTRKKIPLSSLISSIPENIHPDDFVIEPRRDGIEIYLIKRTVEKDSTYKKRALRYSKRLDLYEEKLEEYNSYVDKYIEWINDIGTNLTQISRAIPLLTNTRYNQALGDNIYINNSIEDVLYEFNLTLYLFFGIVNDNTRYKYYKVSATTITYIAEDDIYQKIMMAKEKYRARFGL